MKIIIHQHLDYIIMKLLYAIFCNYEYIDLSQTNIENIKIVNASLNNNDDPKCKGFPENYF